MIQRKLITIIQKKDEDIILVALILLQDSEAKKRL